VLTGKLPPERLSAFLRKIYRPRGDVLLGPGVGEDYAALLADGVAVVVHSDPVTGAGENAGWLAVHVACNDVATSGADPRWLLVTLLASGGSTFERLEELADQIRSAADEVGASVVGGHTEVTPWLQRDIVVTTAMGYTRPDRLIRSSGARPGDLAIVTKAAALEGTAILATDLRDRLTGRVDEGTLRRASEFIREISVVRDARIAADLGAHALHDPTEGGVAAGIQEVAMASGVGVIVREEGIPVRRETLEICGALSVDPMRLVSSGSLLIAAPRESANDIVGELRAGGVEAAVVGEFVEDPSVRVMIRRDGSRLDLNEPVSEELWRVIPG